MESAAKFDKLDRDESFAERVILHRYPFFWSLSVLRKYLRPTSESDTSVFPHTFLHSICPTAIVDKSGKTISRLPLLGCSSFRWSNAAPQFLVIYGLSVGILIMVWEPVHYVELWVALYSSATPWTLGWSLLGEGEWGPRCFWWGWGESQNEVREFFILAVASTLCGTPKGRDVKSALEHGSLHHVGLVSTAELKQPQVDSNRDIKPCSKACGHGSHGS